MTIRQFLTTLAGLVREYDYPLRSKSNNKIKGSNLNTNVAICLSQIDSLVANTPSVITSKAKNIPDERFMDCSTLTAAYLTNVETVGTAAFRRCTNLSKVAIPEATSIGNHAFYGCSSIQYMNLDAVVNIGAYAFNGCTNLNQIIIGMRHNTVCTLANANAFAGTPIADGTGQILVPRNLVNAYKSASGWSTYADRIQGV